MDACSDQLHKVVGVKLHGLPLVEVKADFLSPALVDDDLEVRA